MKGEQIFERKRDGSGKSKVYKYIRPLKKMGGMENVRVQSVNDCRGFESVQVQLRKLVRVSKKYGREIENVPVLYKNGKVGKNVRVQSAKEWRGLESV